MCSCANITLKLDVIIVSVKNKNVCFEITSGIRAWAKKRRFAILSFCCPFVSKRHAITVNGLTASCDLFLLFWDINLGSRHQMVENKPTGRDYLDFTFLFIFCCKTLKNVFHCMS